MVNKYYIPSGIIAGVVGMGIGYKVACYNHDKLEEIDRNKKAPLESKAIERKHENGMCVGAVTMFTGFIFFVDCLSLLYQGKDE